VPLKRNEVTMLALFKEGETFGDSGVLAARTDLYERVIYRCVIGSQAYGLADSESDVDRRGIYLPTATSTGRSTAYPSNWRMTPPRRRTGSCRSFSSWR